MGDRDLFESFHSCWYSQLSPLCRGFQDDTVKTLGGCLRSLSRQYQIVVSVWVESKLDRQRATACVARVRDEGKIERNPIGEMRPFLIGPFVWESFDIQKMKCKIQNQLDTVQISPIWIGIHIVLEIERFLEIPVDPWNSGVNPNHVLDTLLKTPVETLLRCQSDATPSALSTCSISNALSLTVTLSKPTSRRRFMMPL